MRSRPFETRSRPRSLAATHRGFAFYVAFPKGSIRPLGFAHLCRWRPAAPFARCPHWLIASLTTNAGPARTLLCRSSHSLHCISAAPAALDRYPRGITGHVGHPSRSIATGRQEGQG
jgi:hypothetical protein